MEANRIDYKVIQQYLEGKLDPRAMHELEKRALDDPFLADALEGYAASDQPAGQHLSMLQRQLEERIAQQQENKDLFFFTWQRLSVAAAAGLLFISAGILFWMKGNRTEPQLAEHKQVEVKLTPADSLGMEPPAPGIASADRAQPDTSPVLALRLPERPVKAKIAERPEPAARVAATQPERSPVTIPDTISNYTLGEVAVTGFKTQNKTSLATAATVDLSTPIMIRGTSTLPVNQALAGRTAGIIYGKVISKEDGSPLPGVVIRPEGTSVTTTTDAKGEFLLIDSTSRKVLFSSIGYATEAKQMKPGLEQVTIAMEPASSSLSEVVVVGRDSQTEGRLMGAVSQKKRSKPEPEGGWNSYRNYLKNNIRIPASVIIPGKVKVQFSVDAGGELSGFTVEKGLNEACNNEAVRLIKEGPSWKPASGGASSEASVTVQFRK